MTSSRIGEEDSSVKGARCAERKPRCRNARKVCDLLISCDRGQLRQEACCNAKQPVVRRRQQRQGACCYDKEPVAAMQESLWAPVLLIS